MTPLVDEDAMKSSFGFLLIAAAIPVSLRQIGDLVGFEALQVGSLAMLLSVALLVSGRVLYSGITALRSPREAGVARADSFHTSCISVSWGCALVQLLHNAFGSHPRIRGQCPTR